MRGGGLAALLVAIAAAFAAPAAHAAEFDVKTEKDLLDANPGDGTCAADNGKCALRAAVQEANALPGPETINLPKGTFELKKPRSDTPGIEEGDLDLLDTVAITGKSKKKTTIEQTARDRVIRSAAPSGAFLRDLTIAGGDLRQEFHGGGILLEAHPLLVEDAVVRGNTFTMQTNTFGLGGGIAALDGDLTLDNAIVKKNRAHGDFVTGSGAGGGVFLHFDATATIANSNILKNRATTISTFDTMGGGLYLQGPTTMANTTVAQNRADLGGGIHMDSDTGLDAEATTVSGNRARHGAGISVESNDAVEFINSTFSGNELVRDSEGALGTGSAVYIGKLGFVRLTHVTVAENVAGPGQAAIALEDLAPPPGDVSMDIIGSILDNRRSECQGEPLIDEVHLNILGDDSCTGGVLGTNLITDPKLKPLTLNLGPTGFTKTHGLKQSSPAIDFVASGCPPPAVDQRGLARPQGEGFCDAGSFEAEG